MEGKGMVQCDGCGRRIKAAVERRKDTNLRKAGGYIKYERGTYTCACPLCLLQRIVWPNDQCDDYWDGEYAMGSDLQTRCERLEQYWIAPETRIPPLGADQRRAVQQPSCLADGELRRDIARPAAYVDLDGLLRKCEGDRPESSRADDVVAGPAATSWEPESSPRGSTRHHVWTSRSTTDFALDSSRERALCGLQHACEWTGTLSGVPGERSSAVPQQASMQPLTRYASSSALPEPLDVPTAWQEDDGRSLGRQCERNGEGVSHEEVGASAQSDIHEFNRVLGTVVDSVHKNREDVSGALRMMECLKAEVQRHAERLQRLETDQANSAAKKESFQ